MPKNLLEYLISYYLTIIEEKLTMPHISVVIKILKILDAAKIINPSIKICKSPEKSKLIVSNSLNCKYKNARAN